MEFNNKIHSTIPPAGGHLRSISPDKNSSLLKQQIEDVRSTVGVGQTQAQQAQSSNTSRGPITSVTVETTNKNKKILIKFKNSQEHLTLKLAPETSTQQASDPSGKAALKIAALQGNVEAVRVLREAGVVLDEEINACDDSGDTALMVAVKNHQLQTVQALIEAGANVNTCERWDGQTALMMAVKAGKVEIVRALVKAGADVNASDRENDTVLMHAVEFIQQEEVEEEREEGGKLKTKQIDKAEILRLLTQEGNAKIDTEARDPSGKTALMLAIEKGEVAIVETLISAGADVNARDDQGTPALILAKQADIVRILIKNRAFADLRDVHDDEKNTVLMKMATSGSVATIKAFIKALEEAVNQGDYHFDVNAYLNAYNAQGVTALMAAVKKGDIEIVRILLETGANVNACNENGMTALECALEKKPQPQPNMVKLLKEYGANEAFTSEIRRRIWLAHIWGIGGQSTLNFQGKPNRFKLEGNSRNYAISMLHKYTKDFLKSSELVNRSISKENLIKIEECIANSIPLKEMDSKTIEKIHAGEPFFILGGFDGIKKDDGHATSIVLCKNELIVCNRGGGYRSKAVERYSLPAKEVNETMLSMLTNTAYKGPKEYNQMLDNLILKFQLKPKGGFNQQLQKVGNCSWASSKGGLGILLRAYSDPKWGTEEEGANQAAKIGYDLYKEFTNFSRDKALGEYLHDSPRPRAGEPNILNQDGELLEKIKIKCAKKPHLRPLSRMLLQLDKGTATPSTTRRSSIFPQIFKKNPFSKS